MLSYGTTARREKLFRDWRLTASMLRKKVRTMIKLLAFLLFPAIELYLLVKVGSLIGAFNMVLWVFVSAFIGIWAVRSQGQGIMNHVNQEVNQGRVPQSAMLNGLLLFVAGVCLILPGLITDAIGILLLIPFTRQLFLLGLGRYMASQANQVRRDGGGSARVIFYSSSSGFDTRAPAPPKDDGPRQATIIDSTAVELNSADQSANQGTTEDGKAADGAPGTSSPKG